MPIIGGRQVGVRGLGFQGAGKPNAPTINSVTVASDTSVTIAYTLGSNNGAPITTIGITSSPSIALTFTNTDLDGTITVTGSFATSTGYTFTMTATNGTTPFYQTALLVDGATSGVSVKWQNGVAPSAGNTSSIDIYSFTIAKTANATFTAFGSQTKFA